jgi:phosphatidylserine/phosphatidylglycerophosphate/cardiolipin synthase-like enzyme
METTLDHADLPDAFAVWPAMIRAARRSIDAAQFYVSNAPGKLLEPVVTELEAALARGVTVHLLVERSFETVYPETLARLRKAGAEVRSLDLRPVTGGILHAKYFVVDHREAYLGSQNFDWRALEHIQELGARVHVPAVVDGLAAIFAYDWALAAGAPGAGAPAAPATAPATAAAPAAAPARGAAPIRLVASPEQLLPPGIAWDLPQLIGLIDHAEQRVRLQALTYRAADRDGAPWTELEDALRRAAARGVRVEMLLADWSKREATIGGLQRLARTSGIEIRLISIPPWSGGFIPYARVAHTKLLAVDGRAAWLGTSNWEKDYFYRSRNVGLVIEEPALAARIDRFFETGWSSPYTERLDPDATYEAPRIQ